MVQLFLRLSILHFCKKRLINCFKCLQPQYIRRFIVQYTVAIDFESYHFKRFAMVFFMGIPFGCTLFARKTKTNCAARRYRIFKRMNFVTNLASCRCKFSSKQWTEFKKMILCIVFCNSSGFLRFNLFTNDVRAGFRHTCYLEQ